MKKTILSLAIMLLCSTMHAQEETKNAVVSVENDYNPTVVQVNKKDFVPTVEGKSSVKPAELIFSKQATPFAGFTSDRNAKDLLPAQEKPLPGYFRLGYGIRNDIDAKLGYNLRLGRKSHFRFLGAFDGFKCGVNGLSAKWNSRMYNTAVAADFAYKFKKLVFDIAGGFNNRVFNYQERENNNGFSNNQHHLNYNIGMKGTSQLAGPFAYTFNVEYTHSNICYIGGAKDAITEEHINAGTLLSHEIYKKYLRRAGIGIDFNGFVYNSRLHNTANGYRNLLSMDFNPFVDFNFNNWEIMFGAKLNFHIGNGAVFAAAPNIIVNKNLTKRISFYANVTGGRKDNSFRDIERITPYWGYDPLNDKQIKPTYKIVDAVAGTRMTIEPLSFDIFAGYVLTKDDLLQTVSTTAPIVYSTFVQEYTNDLHIGGRIGYDCGGWLRVEADARYDYWTCTNRDYLMMRPEVTVNANIEIYPIKSLIFKAGYNFTRYAKGKTTGRINDKHDLYARISYSINRYFGAFIQGDNLLNSNYFDYAGYYTRGIRGMLGVTMNF